MKDDVLRGYLADFSEQHKLNINDEGELFERFVAYCIVSREYPDVGDVEDLIIGGSQDGGIDAIALFVNGQLVFEKQAIDYLASSGNLLDCHFVFIQSKTGDKFNAGEIGNFLFGVRNFFQDTSAIPQNTALLEFQELKKHLYSKSIKFSQNPRCSLYYVTTGNWVDDIHVSGRIKSELQPIRSTNLFSKVEFVPIDASRLRLLYQEIRRKVAKEIEFRQYTVFPKIAGVRQAYIGVLPCEEFLKLITDSEGELQRSLFYENVRDYLGDNTVNQEIRATIASSSDQDKLPVLNNGVTIVARSVNQVGTTFRLQDYQIVNGCQTSHVIYRNKKSLSPNTYVPIKLIEAQDSELINKIIMATNRQTEVKVEAFEALRSLHKDLEEFYAHVDLGMDPRLFYERRSRQYSGTTVYQYQIVTMPFQLKCFVAVFLEEPHSTHRYYGEILESYRKRVFQERHSQWPYAISAYIYKCIEDAIARGVIFTRHKKYKYHLAFMLRWQFGPAPDLMNQKATEEYCKNILVFIRNQKKCDGRLVDLAQILTSVCKKMLQAGHSEHSLRSLRSFTTTLQDSVSARSWQY